jgi:hypothetical protein
MNGEIVQGGYTKNEIEDFTGCIPLFLDYSVIKYEMDGRIQKKIDLNQDFFQDIYSDAMMFEREIKAKKFAELARVERVCYTPFYPYNAADFSRHYN